MLIMFCMVPFAGCRQNQRTVVEKKHFDFPAYFFDEAGRLDASGTGLIKTLTTDDSVEVLRPERVHWLAELQPFLECDLNKASVSGSYNVDTVKSGQNMVVEYAAIDSTPKLKSARIWITADVPDSIYIHNELSNPYYMSKEILIYRRNGNFSITGYNNPRIGKDIFFTLEGRSVPASN